MGPIHRNPGLLSARGIKREPLSPRRGHGRGAARSRPRPSTRRPGRAIEAGTVYSTMSADASDPPSAPAPASIGAGAQIAVRYLTAVEQTECRLAEIGIRLTELTLRGNGLRLLLRTTGGLLGARLDLVE